MNNHSQNYMTNPFTALDLALVAIQKATEADVPVLMQLQDAIRQRIEAINLKKDDDLWFGGGMDTKGAEQREKKAKENLKSSEDEHCYRDFCHLNWSASVFPGECMACQKSDARCHSASFTDTRMVHYWHVLLCTPCRKTFTGILYHPRRCGAEIATRIIT